MDPKADRCHIVLHQENGNVIERRVPLDFFGDLQTEYEKLNKDYEEEREANGYAKR